jgi:hypothetical protein
VLTAKWFSNDQIALDELTQCAIGTGVMVADNEPLYAYVDIPFKKSAVSSYNSHLQH